MSLRKLPDIDDDSVYSDMSFEDEVAANDKDIEAKRKVRRLLEDRIERKRLQEDLGNDFEWEDDFDDVDIQ